MAVQILHVIDSLGVGGAQAMLFELFHAINKYDGTIVQNIVLTNQGKIDPAFVKSYGIEYSSVPSNLLRRIATEGPNDVVVFYHKLMCSNTDELRGCAGHVPVALINHTHSEGVSYNRIRYVDHVVAVCKHMESCLRRVGVRVPISVIRNTIDPARYRAIEPMPRDEGDAIITGRINALNMIKYSQDWMKWVRSADLPDTLIHEYMGGGAFLKQAKKMASKGRNDIRMLGAVSDFKEKVARLSSWDVFLYEVNRDEGLSIAVLEALACGVPVICSNHFGNKEIIKDGVNGYVFKNKEDLEAILTELMLEPKILEDLKVSTREDFDKNRSPEKWAKAYIDLAKTMLRVPLQKSSPVKVRGVPPSRDKSRKPKRTRIRVKDRKQPRKPPVAKRRKTVEDVEREKKKSAKPKKAITSMGNQPDIRSIPAKGAKFAILTAGHNHGKFIDDYATSILAQKYRPLEVVFVNDASRDNTLDKIRSWTRRFADADIDLKIIDNPRQMHCGAAYQTGFAEITADFIGVVDSDDMLTEDAVEYIMGLYDKYPDVGWIYTQFRTCTVRMQPKGKGFCRPPIGKKSLLDLGINGKHGYSHWRTFSRRTPKLGKIWDPKLHCSVDKFMGYRLEEWATGLFTNHICYNYRQGAKGCISSKGRSKVVWRNVIEQAVNRRKKYNLKPYPVLIHEE